MLNTHERPAGNFHGAIERHRAALQAQIPRCRRMPQSAFARMERQRHVRTSLGWTPEVPVRAPAPTHASKAFAATSVPSPGAPSEATAAALVRRCGKRESCRGHRQLDASRNRELLCGMPGAVPRAARRPGDEFQREFARLSVCRGPAACCFTHCRRPHGPSSGSRVRLTAVPLWTPIWCPAMLCICTPPQRTLPEELQRWVP